jgi:hypothetical protein
MTSPSPPPPPGAGAPTAARPALVFEVTKTIAAYTTDGIAPGGGLKVTVMPEAALQLQKALGVKLFAALFTLICMAGDDGYRLVVDTNATRLAEQLGCSRQKAGELVTQLEQAGFLDREQVRGIGGRADRFGRGRYVLCPELYRAVERRQTLTHRDRPLGDSATVVTKPDTGSRPTDVTEADSSSTGVSGPDIGHESAARTGGGFSDSGARSHPHEDGMNDDHSSLATSDARLTPPSAPTSVAGLPAGQVVALLEQWGVFDAESVVRTADPAVLEAALREISARFTEIKNPGAYLRRLLAGNGSAPQRSRAAEIAPPPPAVPVGAAAPVRTGPRDQDSDPGSGKSLPELTGEQLVTVYQQLPAEDRAEVDRALGRMAQVAGVGWCNVPGLTRTRRLYLVGVLERLGVSAGDRPIAPPDGGLLPVPQ